MEDCTLRRAGRKQEQRTQRFPNGHSQPRNLVDSYAGNRHRFERALTQKCTSGLLRWSLYTALGLAIAVPSTYASIQFWIERVELEPMYRTAIDDADEFGWVDTNLGYSGAHLGLGTDPRLKRSGRNAARAAFAHAEWFSHYTEMLPMDRIPVTSDDIPMIQFPNPSIASAERALVKALKSADHGSEPNDRSMIELTLRLAEVRERMSGHLGLNLALEAWEGLGRTASEELDILDGGGGGYWRDLKVLSDRKRGEVLFRLATALPVEAEDRRKANLDAAKLALGKAISSLVPDGLDTKLTHRPRWSRWWSRSPVERPKLPTESMRPSDLRQLLRCLTTLSSVHAFQGDRAACQSLVTSALSYIPSPTASVEVDTEGCQLHSRWLSSRRTILCTYLAQLTPSDSEEGLESLKMAARSSEAILSESSSPETFWDRLRDAWNGTARYRMARRMVEEEARMASFSAWSLLGQIYETDANRMEDALECHRRSLEAVREDTLIELARKNIDRVSSVIGLPAEEGSGSKRAGSKGLAGRAEDWLSERLGSPGANRMVRS